MNAELDTVARDMQEVKHHASEIADILKPSGKYRTNYLDLNKLTIHNVPIANSVGLQAGLTVPVQYKIAPLLVFHFCNAVV